MDGPDDIHRKKMLLSAVRNKVKRGALFKEVKVAERKMRIKRRAARDPDEPKQTPITQESKREDDATFASGEVDEEVEMDISQDEYASYFSAETTPKVLLTTSDHPGKRAIALCKELRRCIPNSFYYFRRALDLKKVIPSIMAHGFTDLVVVTDDQKVPNGIVISHLPDGPTAHFSLRNLVLPLQLKRRAKVSTNYPELVLNQFKTRLGRSVARVLGALFPRDPQYEGRRVVTFHNQRDYIFFRHHRYNFKNAQKVGIMEIGPRFTLKLKSLQKGTFDTKFGEYIWLHKRKQMDSSRLKWHL